MNFKFILESEQLPMTNRQIPNMDEVPLKNMYCLNVNYVKVEGGFESNMISPFSPKTYICL